MQITKNFGQFRFFNGRLFAFLLLIFFPLTQIGCSFDEDVVKKCGNEHPNSTWGQFLCQRNVANEIAKSKEKIRIAEENEARNKCFTKFVNNEFPAKARDIYKTTKGYFDKDIKFLSNHLTHEIGLTKGNKYTKEKDGISVNSIDFKYNNQCDIKNLSGIAKLSFDESGNALSLNIYTEWIDANQLKVANELKDFAHQRIGRPVENKKKLGDYFYLITELEKKLGSYDSKEGCFYFTRKDVNQKNQQIQLGRYQNILDIWPDDARYCLVIDRIYPQIVGSDKEISIILTGNGDFIGRSDPGVVSVHAFLINEGKVNEQFHSIHPVGNYQQALKNWEPVRFTIDGPVGWINKQNYCAQGCWDRVTFLIPDKGKYWPTQFDTSSWSGQIDHANNNFRINFELINTKSTKEKYDLKLDLVGLHDGTPIKKSTIISYDSKKNFYPIPKNSIPPN